MEPVQQHTYRITVEGHLDEKWTDWFDGFIIAHLADGSTQLTGPVADQPALQGLLNKITQLGLVLVSVCRC